MEHQIVIFTKKGIVVRVLSDVRALVTVISEDENPWQGTFPAVKIESLRPERTN